MLVQFLPPHGVVVQIQGHVGENGPLLGGGQGVGVGLGIGAWGYAKESLLRVHRPQPAIFSHTNPGDVIPHAPAFPAVFLIALRGDQHGQVGLAAGRGEGTCNITDLPLGILNPQNQHVLRQPALLPAQVGGNPQGKAFLSLEHVAAVAGVNGHNDIVLRELHNIPLLRVQVGPGVEALDKLFIQVGHSLLARPGHNGHVQNHVNGIRELNAILGKGRAHNTHAIGNHVHGAAFHRTIVQAMQLGIHLLRVHPVVGGTGILLFLTADEGPALHPGHVAGVGPVKITAGEFFLVKLVELSRGASLLPQRFQLLLTAVDPNDLVWLGQLYLLVNPIQHGSIFCQFHVKCPP